MVASFPRRNSFRVWRLVLLSICGGSSSPPPQHYYYFPITIIWSSGDALDLVLLMKLPFWRRRFIIHYRRRPVGHMEYWMVGPVERRFRGAVGGFELETALPLVLMCPPSPAEQRGVDPHIFWCIDRNCAFQKNDARLRKTLFVIPFDALPTPTSFYEFANTTLPSPSARRFCL